jgi:hypothetical protein
MQKKYLFDIPVLSLCAVALFYGIRATGDLTVPSDVDHYRDIGLAQTILDHRYGEDHLYQGETIWYNPLLSIIIANVSRLTGVEPVILAARGGAYFNLLAPIAFYALVTFLFDRRVALASTAAFLFAIIPPGTPSLASASYSPSVFGENLVQALFYFSLLAYAKALESRRLWWYIAVGVLLGITFLGQTAPAVILGVIIVTTSVKNWIEEARSGSNKRSFFRGLGRLGLIILIAFVVSLPLTFSILGRYHLRILNSAPSNWMYPPLSLANIGSFTRENLSWFTVIAAVGLVALILERTNRPRRSLLLPWLTVCFVELSLNFIQQPHLHLMFVPAYHFLFYLKAIENMLFGVGLVFVCRWLSRDIASTVFPAMSGSSRLAFQLETLLILTGVVFFLAVVLPAYGSRWDFTGARERSKYQARSVDMDAYHWILSHAQPEDVFFSVGGNLDLTVVAPAARKVVVTSIPEFSNPYVSYTQRFEAATLMWNELTAGSPNALSTLKKYQVKYLITLSDLAHQIDHRSALFLSRDFAEANVIIYRVKDEGF